MAKHRQRRPWYRRWWTVFAAVVALASCGLLGVFLQRDTRSGPETPRAAVDQVMRGIERYSINEFEVALCAAKRNQAGVVLREFRRGMVAFQQRLEDMRWTVTEEHRRSKTAVDVDVKVTFTVVEKNKRENRDFPMTLRVIEENGWYVCDIKVLTL